MLDVRRFVFAGNARFTLTSAKTGARYTFRVRAWKRRPGAFFVDVLTGADNETDYSRVGMVVEGRYRHSGTHASVGPDAPSARAIGWFLTLLQQGHLSPLVTVHHEGRCGRCGRALTVPESIESGIGPECARKTG